jgi:hypothetical protein
VRRDLTIDELPERTARIIALRRAGHMYNSIGREVGVTRERARQIAADAVARLGWPVGVLRPEPRHACSRCRHRVLAVELKGGRCVDCRLRRCRECGRTFDSHHGRVYCDGCTWAVRPCANCGNPVAVRRSRSRLRNRVWYCDRLCHGAVLGRRHGAPALRAWAARKAAAL